MVLALPAPSAAAKSPRDKFVKGFSKQANDGTFKRGFCVCMGGTQNGRVGLIWPSSIGTGVIEYFLLSCYASTFDRTTGDFVGDTPCDGTWIPLPK